MPPWMDVLFQSHSPAAACIGCSVQAIQLVSSKQNVAAGKWTGKINNSSRPAGNNRLDFGSKPQAHPSATAQAICRGLWRLEVLRSNPMNASIMQFTPADLIPKSGILPERYTLAQGNYGLYQIDRIVRFRHLTKTRQSSLLVRQRPPVLPR